MKHSSLDLTWNLAINGWNLLYLCHADTNLHITEATDAFQLGHSFYTYEILNRVFEIRQMKISEGINFLSCTRNETFAAHLLQKNQSLPLDHGFISWFVGIYVYHHRSKFFLEFIWKLNMGTDSILYGYIKPTLFPRWKN